MLLLSHLLRDYSGTCCSCVRSGALSYYNAVLLAQASVAEATAGLGKGTAEAALELCDLAPALLQTGKLRPLSLSANCASSSYTALCRQ